jgi:hypothetical protein
VLRRERLSGMTSPPLSWHVLDLESTEAEAKLIESATVTVEEALASRKRPKQGAAEVKAIVVHKDVEYRYGFERCTDFGWWSIARRLVRSPDGSYDRRRDGTLLVCIHTKSDGERCHYISDDLSNFKKHLTTHLSKGEELEAFRMEKPVGKLVGAQILAKAKIHVVLKVLRSGLAYNQFVDNGELSQVINASLSAKTFRSIALKISSAAFRDKRELIKTAKSWVSMSFDTSSKESVTHASFASVVVHFIDEAREYQEVSLGCIEFIAKSDSVGIRSFLEGVMSSFGLRIGIEKGCVGSFTIDRGSGGVKAIRNMIAASNQPASMVYCAAHDASNSFKNAFDRGDGLRDLMKKIAALGARVRGLRTLRQALKRLNVKSWPTAATTRWETHSRLMKAVLVNTRPLKEALEQQEFSSIKRSILTHLPSYDEEDTIIHLNSIMDRLLLPLLKYGQSREPLAMYSGPIRLATMLIHLFDKANSWTEARLSPIPNAVLDEVTKQILRRHFHTISEKYGWMHDSEDRTRTGCYSTIPASLILATLSPLTKWRNMSVMQQLAKKYFGNSFDEIAAHSYAASMREDAIDYMLKFLDDNVLDSNDIPDDLVRSVETFREPTMEDAALTEFFGMQESLPISAVMSKRDRVEKDLKTYFEAVNDSTVPLLRAIVSSGTIFCAREALEQWLNVVPASCSWIATLICACAAVPNTSSQCERNFSRIWHILTHARSRMSSAILNAYFTSIDLKEVPHNIGEIELLTMSTEPKTVVSPRGLDRFFTPSSTLTSLTTAPATASTISMTKSTLADDNVIVPTPDVNLVESDEDDEDISNAPERFIRQTWRARMETHPVSRESRARHRSERAIASAEQDAFFDDDEECTSESDGDGLYDDDNDGD